MRVRERAVYMEVASGSSIVTYKECQKNHTISMGSHVKDGCAAFMPNITKENGLFCHACGCHRNFHRQEVKAVTEDALDAIPVAVHGKIHGGSINSGITQRNPGSIKCESGLNSVIIDLEDVIDLSDDDPVITTESVSKRTAIKAKQRRFTEEEVKKMNKVCEFLDYKSPGKYGQGAEKVNRLCQEVGISRDSFRKYLYRRKEFRGTSRF